MPGAGAQAGPRALTERRNELLVLGVALAATVALAVYGSAVRDRPVPPGVVGLGLVQAGYLLLHAIGMVLAYRSNRFLNFAQVQIGALGGTLFAVLVQAGPLLRLVRAVCPPCMDRTPEPIVAVNYLVAVAAGLGLAVGVARLMYAAVVRRFTDASPLIMTVASIFVVQVLAGLRDPVVSWLTTEEQQALGVPGGPVRPPVNVDLQVPGAVFGLADILAVLVAVTALVGLTVYLRGTATGTAIRAAADNRERAQSLGIDVGGVVGRVWTLIGFLSGAAAILAVMSGGEAAVSGGLNVSVLVRILAVIIVARLVSLPMAAAASVVLGVLGEVVFRVMGSGLLLDGLLVLVIGALLLVQRSERSRADAAGAGSWRSARELRRVPAVLRQLPEIRRYRRIGIAMLAVVALGLPWIMSPRQTNLLALALIYAIIGLSLLILTGWAGLVSLGQMAFAGVGAFVAGASGLPMIVALPLGGMAGAVIAVVVGFPALRLRGIYLAVTTLAFSLATTAVLLNSRYLGAALPSSMPAPSLLGMQMDDQRVSYYVMLTMLGLAVAAVAGLRRSRTGRVLIAARDNEPAAQLVGVGVARARLVAFVVSGMLAAVAGVLAAYHQGGVRAEAFSPELSVLLFVYAVVGGFGTIAGPLLGFALYAVVSLLSTSATVVQLAGGIGGLALVLASPGGLIEVVHRVRDTALRRIAKRHRIVVPTLATGAEDSLQHRAPIRQKLLAGGGTAFVPRRYGLTEQWAIGPTAPDGDVGDDPAVLRKEPVDV